MKRSASAATFYAKKRKLGKKSVGTQTPKWKRKFRKGKAFKKLAYNKNKSLSGSKLIKKKLDKWEKLGVKIKYERHETIQTSESGGTTSPTQFAIIGHATTVYEQVLQALCHAMVKGLALKMEHPLQSFNETSPTSAGDIWNIRWQSTPATAVTTTALGVPAAAPWSQVVSLLYNILDTIVTETSELLQFEFRSAGTTGNAVMADIPNSSFYFKCKSQMRLQNISLPSDSLDDTADEVDAVPLHGTTFVGKGSGTALVRPRSAFTIDAGLYAGIGTGIISRRYAIDTQVLRDIPRAEELVNVSKSGKIVMPAGSIQASTLYDYQGGYINSIFRKIKNERQGFTFVQKSVGMGKFAVHMLQKVIEPVGGDAVSPIKLGYQFDQETDAYCVFRRSFATTKLIVSQGSLVQ